MGPHNIESRTEEAWSALTSGSAEPSARKRALANTTGRSNIFESNLPVTDIAVACVSAALLAGSELGALRASVVTGTDVSPADVSVDQGHVAAAVTSERHFRSEGRSPLGSFAPLSRFWRAKDGWVRTHANYRWHKAALLSALDCPDDPDAVATTIATMCADAVEDRVFSNGGIAAMIRSTAVWRTHPQGAAVAAEPLIAHQCVGNAPPRADDSTQSVVALNLPATGIRVLDMTRVIAGPVCTRFLGAMGADVLRIDPPDHPDIKAGSRGDTLFSKRSAPLDLTDPLAIGRLHQVLDRADVLVAGYRPGSLDRFGLGPDELAQRHPGLVVCYICAWGHTGPWSHRRGFDSVVQGPTGLAMAESRDGGETPGALPCQLLDHGTGYLTAAAVLDGLIRQRTGGGTHFRRLSLARTAHWLTSAPNRAADPGAGNDAAAPDESDWLITYQTPDGPVTAVTPPGSIGGASLSWSGAPTAYLSDHLTWMS
ncbi:MAG: CoA transferase [Acidimicrobiales bacterium]